MKVIEHISFFPDLFSMKSKTNTGIFLFILLKLVDCLEKCLIYGHIRRFAD